jgi:hypothetical protein
MLKLPCLFAALRRALRDSTIVAPDQIEQGVHGTRIDRIGDRGRRWIRRRRGAAVPSGAVDDRGAVPGAG